MPSPKEPLYQIRNSAIHGTGVFATRAIRKGQRILEYTGEKISKEESERRGIELMERAKKDGGAAVYIFTLDDEWDLDGGVEGNDARLINHSCDPNCEAWDHSGHIWIHAKRAIKQGEELSFNYGFTMDTWEDHPCRCGTAKCVGYIVGEEYWPQLHAEIAKRDAAAARKTKRDAARKKESAGEKSGSRKSARG